MRQMLQDDGSDRPDESTARVLYGDQWAGTDDIVNTDSESIYLFMLASPIIQAVLSPPPITPLNPQWRKVYREELAGST